VVTADELEVLARRTVATMHRLSPPQRDLVVTRILESDPELAAALPAVLAAYRTAKRIRRLGPLIRDGVM
jgi:hypothetical protein